MESSHCWIPVEIQESKSFFDMAIKRGSRISRTREKLGRPKALITNGLIKDFQ